MSPLRGDPSVRSHTVDCSECAYQQQTPEALRAHHNAEIAKWWPVIKQAGIKVE